MATYEETVLANNPVLFIRMDEVGGTVMHDSSSFETHGTFYSPTFGFPSPIETDPASAAIAGSVGKVLIADAPQADVRTNFTLEVWGWNTGSFTQVSHLITRNGQIGLNGGTWLAIDNSNARFHLFNGSDWELTFSLPVANHFYHLVGVRNATVMQLYVDGVMVAERTDVSVADMDPQGDTAWYFGSSANQNLWLSFGTDEAAIYGTALTAAQVLENYEAAFNAIFLNGQSNVIPTAILLSDFEPDPVEFPWRHNWVEVLTERLSFRSATSQAVDGSEAGVSERIAPRRELEFTQVLRDDRERRRLRALLWANQHAKWFVPIRQYAEQLLTALTATATSTAVDTVYRDYEVGGWVGFRQVSDAGVVEHSEVRLITALTATTIEHDALVNSYAAYRSLVYPVRRALLPASVSITGHTDSVEEVTLTARLLPEDEAVVPNRITVFSPTLKYRDIEVFDGLLWQSNDWSELREYEVERAQETIDFDTGLMSYESDTAGASETFSYRMVLQGHANIAAFLGWYYERVGALQPVWVPTMQRDFEILTINVPNQEIQVHGTNYSDAYVLAESRRDLAFIYTDGTMKFRRVVGFAGTPNEALELDASIPSLTNLRAVSLLKLCRLDADQLELAWQTDNVVQVAWRFRELPHTPEGTGVSSLSPSASRSLSLSPSGSASPSASVSPSLSPSLSPSPSSSVSPSASVSPSGSQSPSASGSPTPSASTSPSASISPSGSISASVSASASVSPSASFSPSASVSPSSSTSPSASLSPSASASPSV